MAWEAALRIQDSHRRAQALALLALKLDPESRTRTQAVEMILDAVAAPKLVTFQQAMRERPLMNPLVVLAPLLSDHDLRRAVEVAPQLGGMAAFEALAALTQRLPEAERTTILDQAVTPLLTGSPVDRVTMLKVLCPVLSDSQLQRVLKTVLENPKEILFDDHVAALAAHIRDESQAETLLELALTRQDGFRCHKILVPLIPRLTERQIRRLAALVLAIRYDRELVSQPPCEPTEMERLSGLEPQESDHYRGAIMGELSAYVPDDLIPAWYEAALDLGDAWGSCQALSALLPRLNSKQCEIALRVLLDASPALMASRGFDAIISKAAPYLTCEMTYSLIKIALKVERNELRTALLKALLPDTSLDAMLTLDLRTLLVAQLRTEAAVKVCADTRLFRPPLVSPEMIRRAAADFSAIAWDWRWPS